MNVTSDKYFTYQIPLNEMSLDNGPVQMANISGISINNTNANWLTVDNATAIVSGTPPTDSNGIQYYQITLSDLFYDLVSFDLQINVTDSSNGNSSSIFTATSLGVVNATQGQFFQYSLKNVLLDTNAKLNASFSPSVNWISFDADNNTLTGMVPDNFDQTQVTISAVDGDRNESTTLSLTGVPQKNATPTQTATPTASSATASSTSTTPASNGPSGKTIAIICGTVIPICVIAALVVFLCCYRNRKKQLAASEKRRTISPPIIDHDLEKGNKNMYVDPLPNAYTRPQRKNPYQTNNTSGRNRSDADSFEWDTPQMAVEKNFMKMDSIEDYYYSGDETQVEDNSFEKSVSDALRDSNESTPVVAQPPYNSNGNKNNINNKNNSNNNSAEVPQAIPTGEAATPRTRNSWRQSNDVPTEGGRWQEHKSIGSLATISTDELLTMRLVDRNSQESAGNNYYEKYVYETNKITNSNSSSVYVWCK